MTSPVINKIVNPTMTFSQAIIQLTAGKKISRQLWDSKEEYGILRNGWLQIHTKGDFHTWKVSDGDLVGTDWFVVEDGVVEVKTN